MSAPYGINDRVAYDAKQEIDPTGRKPNEAGAKVDAGKPRMSMVLGGFSDALVEVVRIGTFGAAKYTDGGWRTVPNGFQRYEDAQMRHQFYRHSGEEYDPESHYLHLAHEAWNALAKLQLFIDNERKNGRSI